MYELVTFCIAAFGGGLSVILSNSLTDDESIQRPLSTKLGVQNALFAASIFIAMLLTNNPILHCVLPVLPFLLGYVAPRSATSFASRLSILAPHALIIFIASYYFGGEAPGSDFAPLSASNAIVVLVVVLAFIPDYTEKGGLAILFLTLLACVPPTLDFKGSSNSPVKPPLTALTAFLSISMISWLVVQYNHKNGPLTVVKSSPTTRSFSIACLCSLRIMMTLSAVRLADAHVSYARDPTLVMLQVFMGANTGLFLSTFPAAVSECWYPVGSMQFQMVTWDTFGLMFYFGFPVAILCCKAWTMYSFGDTLISWGLNGGDAYKIVNWLTTLMVTIIGIGLPMLNKHSFLCSNW